MRSSIRHPRFSPGEPAGRAATIPRALLLPRCYHSTSYDRHATRAIGRETGQGVREAAILDRCHRNCHPHRPTARKWPLLAATTATHSQVTKSLKMRAMRAIDDENCNPEVASSNLEPAMKSQ